MSHELEVLADGTASMFYSGALPWHRLGVGVAEAQTSEEAIALAHMDWDVALGDLRGGPQNLPIDGRRSVYRVTDGRVLGVVGMGYQPVQNHEAFAFLDALVADRVLRYTSAGVLYRGSQVWIQARLDEDIEVAGDKHIPYLTLVNSHDGSATLRVYPTVVRVVCANTVSMSLRELGRSGRRGVALTHTRSITDRLEQARTTLQITTEQMRRYAEWLKRLAETPVGEEVVEGVQVRMFGPLDDQTPPQRERAIQLFRQIYYAEEVHAGATAYSLANAVTGYADHGIQLRPRGEDAASARMANILFGAVAEFREKGLLAIADLADVPFAYFREAVAVA